MAEADGAETGRKAARLFIEISRKTISLREVQRLAATGIPEQSNLRSTVWKVLLRYLPPTRDEWDAELARNRKQYADFCRELIINPTEVERKRTDQQDLEQTMNSGKADAGRGSAAGATEATEAGMCEGELRPQGARGAQDHPLCLAPNSVWHQYFKDSEIAAQIERDVLRTHPDDPFFAAANPNFKRNQDAMRRVLFLFAKLNQGLHYVQGMNEILAPLYFVFASDNHSQMADNAEADSFFCFMKLLPEFRDNFCQQLDNSASGIKANMQRLSAMLRQHDKELWNCLENTSKINPQFYSFRWITLLLTQEFRLVEILRIWDYLLSHLNDATNTLLKICCAMLICVRHQLLAGDFSSNLKLLQNYPMHNIELLLRTTNQLL